MLYLELEPLSPLCAQLCVIYPLPRTLVLFGSFKAHTTGMLCSILTSLS